MSSLSSVGGTGGALTNPTAGSATGTLSVGGLISGLNTNQLIQGLLAVQQAQIAQVQARQGAVTQREVAYKALQAQLIGFQSSVTALAQASNGPFDARTATSSAQTVLTAAASSSAVPGVYSLTVNSLAQANEIASQGFDSLTASVTHGTLTVGSGSTSKTVTIDGTNDTLQGLAAAINGAGAGVSATVINDGRSHPYRLLLTANNTGTANAITLTNNLAASGNGAVQPVFNANTIGAAVAAAANTGTAAATSGGTFTGTTNNTYTFTVTSGGTVGTTNGITLSYADSTGAHTGTITLNAGDLNALKPVAEGVQVAFGAGTLNAGDKFTIDTTVSTVQQAANAAVTLGSGSGALTVTSASNTLNNVINGVTLNLVGTSATPVQVTVASDTATAKKAVEDFVSAYNGVIDTIANDTSYDAQTKKAGVLLGDPSIVGIETQLRDLATAPVAVANAKLNSLSALGITPDANGHLQVNDGQLTSVLSGQVSGVSLSDVRNLFALSGQSTNPGVAFANATAATKAATYGVVITQAARQAAVTADAAPPSLTFGAGNTFTLTVNGQTSNPITVPANAYGTAQALVQALQAQVNGDSKVGGGQVTVGLASNGSLTFTSGTYGSTSAVGISAAAFLGFNSAKTAGGADVAGSFLVNGTTAEAATGQGQLLTGSAGNANTAGLSVNVTTSQVSSSPTSPVANVTVSRGVAGQLSAALNGLLDPVSGRLQTIDQNFQAEIAAYQKTIDHLNQQYTAKQNQLTLEFTNLETTLSNLKNTSSFLTSQVATLQALQIGTSPAGRTTR
jgi:flagellar hook-associated protein 2